MVDESWDQTDAEGDCGMALDESDEAQWKQFRAVGDAALRRELTDGGVERKQRLVKRLYRRNTDTYTH